MSVRKKPAAETSVKRTVYTIRWDKRLKCWVTKVNGFIIHVWKGITKGEAIDIQVNHCRMHWIDAGVLSELRICNKAGQYQPARSYGNDPKSPG